VKTEVIQEALFRFADSVIQGEHRYLALEAFLRREAPAIKGHEPGEPLIAGGQATVQACTDVVMRMDSSYLFVQGPPGAGKTFTGSHVIVALVAAGIGSIAPCATTLIVMQPPLGAVLLPFAECREICRLLGSDAPAPAKAIQRNFLNDRADFANVRAFRTGPREPILLLRIRDSPATS
jgi:hypothetical protein